MSFKNHPNLICSSSFEMLMSNQAEVRGRWITARPLGAPTLRERIKLAWMVLIGRADALVWPGQ